MIDLHSEDWADDAPTTFYPTGRSQSSQPPPPVAIPLVRQRRPAVTLEIRDFLVAAPWAFSLGLLAARAGLPFQFTTAAVAGAAFGVVFDRYVRRFL